MSTPAMPAVPQSNPHEVEHVLRGLARLVAPYVAAELRQPRPAVSADWDDATCRLYVSELSVDVAKRALVLFDALVKDGKISSVELAKRLHVNTPKALSGFMTTSLKRRARKLDLPLPFDGGEGSQLFGGIPDPADGDDPQRTYWVDRDGIAERMLEALHRRIEETTPKLTRLRFGVIVECDPMPSLGMGSERSETLKAHLEKLGGAAEDDFTKPAVFARFEIEAGDEDEAIRTAVGMFEQALEEAEIFDAYGNTPRAQLAEPVERIDG